MKNLIHYIIATSFLFFSCSDDESSDGTTAQKICETCTNDKGQNQELCDNGNGTFTRTTELDSGEDDVDSFTLQQLEAVGLGTFELWVASNCSDQ